MSNDKKFSFLRDHNRNKGEILSETWSIGDSLNLKTRNIDFVQLLFDTSSVIIGA